MLYSSKRKQALSGWLKMYHEKEFLSSLKLQKFLFFYETLSKTEKEPYEFRKLRGYLNGPVFSDVYGDYRHRNTEFYEEAYKTYMNNKKLVNDDRAKLAAFLVSILNDYELSKLTHKFNIWKAKQKYITPSAKNVQLNENDFNEEDAEFLSSIKNMYPIDYIDSVEVNVVDGKSFILNKKDKSKLNNKSDDIFISLANDSSLQNPVYISIADDGVVIVD